MPRSQMINVEIHSHLSIPVTLLVIKYFCRTTCCWLYQHITALHNQHTHSHFECTSVLWRAQWTLHKQQQQCHDVTETANTAAWTVIIIFNFRTQSPTTHSTSAIWKRNELKQPSNVIDVFVSTSDFEVLGNEHAGHAPVKEIVAKRVRQDFTDAAFHRFHHTYKSKILQKQVESHCQCWIEHMQYVHSCLEYKPYQLEICMFH